MKRYNPKEIEPRWQQQWADDKLYEADEDSAADSKDSKPKKYILEYFPYPSGAAMHVGHVRNYTIGDALTRYARMRGYNVLHPMGWDAFGLPAENYAIKTRTNPKEAIKQNTSRFKQQLTQMGFGYDWSREFASSDPDYYKWTQWFFLLLHRRGLAYRKESLQWWCPFDKTVLANEQVENGLCWRCGNEVEKKALPQWFFKITDYADRLVDDLEDLNWTDSIKSMQRNWIGRKKGIDITYKITNANKPATITTFTTHPDTNFGATFIVVAPEHPLVQQVIDGEITPAGGESHAAEVADYKKAALAKSDVERQEEKRTKTGAFTGLYAENNLTGRQMPIWVSDFVLMQFGTGAVVGVPAHDTRDFQFAKQFDIPIIEVVEPVTGTPQQNPEFRRSIVAIVRRPQTGEFLSINWGKQGGNLFIGGGREENEDIVETAMREVAEETGYTNLKLVAQTGRIHHHYFAHSKGVARQIEAHGLLFDLVDDSRTAQKLETDEQGKFSVEWLPKNEVESKVSEELHALAYDLLVRGNCYIGEGVMVNSGTYDGMSTSETREKIAEDMVADGTAEWRTSYKIRDWLISRQRYWGAPIPMIHCPNCGIVPVPEDQLPVTLPDLETFEPSGDGRSPLARVPEFVNTTCPECGGPAERETDTMDGFACSSWYFLRFADPHNADKAFDPAKVKRWLAVDDYIGGAEHAVMHLLYARMWTKVMQDEGLIDFGEPFKTLRNHGMILAPDGQKMSKSKGNTIEPDSLIEQGYGADAIRIMELFIGPWNQSANWSVEGMGGSFRFLQRIWALAQELHEDRGSTDEGWQTAGQHPPQARSSEVGEGTSGLTGPPPQAGDEALKRAINLAVHRVSKDLTELGFNTAIAALMETVNELYKLKTTVPMGVHGDTWQWAIETLLQLLAPFAPHIAEELWHQLGHDDSIHTSTWPAYDEQYLQSDTMTIAVQVNGKLRAQLQVASDATEATIFEVAQADQKVTAHIADKTIKKRIYVPGKLVNFVVN